MAYYQPKDPFLIPFNLLVPTPGKILGVSQLTYSPSSSSPLFCSMKTFGGTEVIVDNMLSVMNTGVIETWWTPEFKNNCRIVLLQDQSEWEILNVENIDMRNQYARIKIRQFGGSA